MEVDTPVTYTLSNRILRGHFLEAEEEGDRASTSDSNGR